MGRTVSQDDVTVAGGLFTMQLNFGKVPWSARTDVPAGGTLAWKEAGLPMEVGVDR